VNSNDDELDMYLVPNTNEEEKKQEGFDTPPPKDKPKTDLGNLYISPI
jgi:hypothetical protein